MPWESPIFDELHGQLPIMLHAPLQSHLRSIAILTEVVRKYLPSLDISPDNPHRYMPGELPAQEL